MRKLREEQILQTTEQPLSETDLSLLQTRRNKQLIYLLSTYLALAAVLLYTLIDGVSVINGRVSRFRNSRLSEEDIERFHLIAPYFCGIFFVILTIYFIRCYQRTLVPVIRELREKKKILLYFIPEKNEMAFFNRYYLSTPVMKKQQIEVSREDFYRIPAGEKLILEMTPYSQIMLRFTYDGIEIPVGFNPVEY